MALQTWVARFVVDQGRVTEEGARLRSFERRRLDEPDVDLYLLAEPSGARGDELAGQALDAIGRQFQQDRLSLTGGIQRALRATNVTLLEWNRRSLAPDQVSVGITGAVVSGPVVYLAQAGQSLAFLQRGGNLQLLAPDENARSPMGESAFDPSLRRFELEPGDMLVVTAQSLESAVSFSTFQALLARGSDEALPELYLLTRAMDSFALFAVTCLESEESPGTESPRLADEEQLPDGPRSLRPWPISGALGQQDDTDEEPVEAASVTGAQDADGEERRPGASPTQPRSLVPPSALKQDDASRSTAVMVAPRPLDISRPVVRLRGSGGSGRSTYARTVGGVRRINMNPAQPRVVLVTAAAAILLFVGAFAVPDLIRENRSEKFAGLIQGAQTQYSAALGQPDPAQKRALLEDTSRLASEALRLEPQDTTAIELRQQAASAITQLNAVFELGPMTTVTTLSRQVTGEVSVEEMTLAGRSAYLLDSKGGRVLEVGLNSGSTPNIVFQNGASYGGVPAKKPRYLAWEANTAGGRLLVLDEERKLFEIKAGSPPTSIPLRRTNSWSGEAGIAAFDGNFYVLDAKGNQVHRYLPAATGFDSEPGSALSGAHDLGNAIGMAVNGDMFVLFKGGKVHRYRGGADAGFTLAGIDREIKTPTDIAVVGSTDEVYIADAGNKRVVVAAEDGVYLRQLVSSAFTDLKAIAVDQDGAQLYVMVGDALLTAPIVR